MKVVKRINKITGMIIVYKVRDQMLYYLRFEILPAYKYCN